MWKIKSLQNKQTDGKDIEKQLEQLKVDLEETKVERDKIIDQQKYVDVLRNILNDKGAKSQIIKKYVPMIDKIEIIAIPKIDSAQLNIAILIARSPDRLCMPISPMQWVIRLPPRNWSAPISPPLWMSFPDIPIL